MKKTVLLFLVFLLGLGTMTVQAQENSESTDLALYQKATKAIKDKKFVFKASLFDDGKRYYQVHHAQNYIVLEDDVVTMSCRMSKGRNNAMQGRVSDYRLKTDKQGNLHLSFSVKSNKSRLSKWNFYIKKGFNHCVVVSNPMRNDEGFTFIGDLETYDTSELKLPLIYDQFNRITK